MATPPQLTQISFAAGIDESQQVEVLDPSRAFLVLQNGRQDSRGSYTKRLGYASLPLTRLGTSRSSGRKLLEYNGQPVVIDSTNQLDSYSETAGRSILRSRVPECAYRLLDIPSPTRATVVHDVEHCNGYVAVAYAYSLASATNLIGTTAVALVSGSTGAIILDPTTIGGAAGVTVIGSYGSRYFVAFHYNNSTTALTAYRLDTQNLSTGWTSIGTVAATTSNAYPAVCSLSDRVAVVYGTGAGVTVATYNVSGVIQTQAFAVGTPSKVSIDGSSAGTLWVAYSVSLTVYAMGLSPTSLSTTVASVVSALTATSGVINIGICEGATAGTARAWVASNVVTRFDMCALSTSGGSAVAGAQKTVYNVLPTSRAFQQGGRYYMAFVAAATAADVSGNNQALCIVADWTADTTVSEVFLRPVANIEPGLVPAIGFFCKFSAVGTTKRVYGFQIAKQGGVTYTQLVGGIGAAGCKLVELDFATRDRWQSARHGNGLFLSNALLSVYDGDVVGEVGFLCRPKLPTSSLSAGALTGTYKYVAVYETIDATGNVIVSGVSSAMTASPSSQNVTVSTVPYTITARARSFANNVAFYRTAAGGEPPYYRLASVAFDGTTDTVSYADSTLDATLTTQAKLYAPTLPGTAGEAQDRRAPPGLMHIVSYNGMLVGAKGASLFYSGQEVYGEATWFSPAFEVPLSGVGDITGLSVLDGAVYVFRADSVYAVNGDAPTDNGAVGGLGVPRVLASDVGCVEPNSIVACSMGIFFQSRRGIELLTRSGSVIPIGEPIQNTLSAFPVVSSAVLDEKNGLIRISLASAESSGVVSSGGRDIVYDLTAQAWVSVDDKTGSSAHEASQDATMIELSGERRYAWLGTDGTVRYEQSPGAGGAYYDGANWVTMVAETAWFKTTGLQGLQHLSRVLFLARKATDAKLSVALAYNYETSFRTARQWTMTELNDLLSDGWPITQLRHDPHDDAECQAVRVRFEDTSPTTGAPSGTGQGFVWIGVTLDITPKPGVFDVPEEAT